ncbi:ADP-ribosyltransferase [Mycoplasma sp. P36-A1]|uniref:ADP-ribosyltransferase n=1 Tax=Mycoplasma sp. P36-A1 TaxID=3252900 RepID=UPI003C2CDA16
MSRAYVRVARGSKPCKWCLEQQGTGDEQSDISFARHDSCQCAIISTGNNKEYTGAKKGVWEERELGNFRSRINEELSKIVDIVVDKTIDVIDKFVKADVTIINKLEKQSKSWYKELDKYEAEAITRYTDVEASIINEYLSGKSKNIVADINANIHHISETMDKFNLKDDVITFRGTNSKYYNDINVGEKFKEKIFYSTTLDENMALEFKEDVILEIYVPKNSRCCYIGEQSLSPDEKELLLDKDTKYKLLKKEKDKIILEVVD